MRTIISALASQETPLSHHFEKGKTINRITCVHKRKLRTVLVVITGTYLGTTTLGSFESDVHYRRGGMQVRKSIMAAIHRMQNAESPASFIVLLLLVRPCLVSGAVVCVFLSSVRMFRNLKIEISNSDFKRPPRYWIVILDENLISGLKNHSPSFLD